MLALVLVTRDAIPSALAGLPPPWNGVAGASSGTRGAAGGPAGTAGVRAEANASGAWLDFYGIVRDREDGIPIVAIDYEAHEAMAVHQMERILDDLGAKYPLNAVLVIHRIGCVPAGEASLLVRILSPHRGEALQACAGFLDALKQRVPIWKHPIPEAAPGGPS